MQLLGGNWIIAVRAKYTRSLRGVDFNPWILIDPMRALLIAFLSKRDFFADRLRVYKSYRSFSSFLNARCLIDGQFTREQFVDRSCYEIFLLDGLTVPGEHGADRPREACLINQEKGGFPDVCVPNGTPC